MLILTNGEVIKRYYFLLNLSISAEKISKPKVLKIANKINKTAPVQIGCKSPSFAAIPLIHSMKLKKHQKPANSELTTKKTPFIVPSFNGVITETFTTKTETKPTTKESGSA